MARGKADNLESFAKRIMTRLKKGGDTDSLERIICRHLTGENEKVSAFLADKLVQWRYGTAKQRVEHTGEGGGPVEHTIRFGSGPSSDEA